MSVGLPLIAAASTVRETHAVTTGSASGVILLAGTA
jgi:hypothetical protein